MRSRRYLAAVATGFALSLIDACLAIDNPAPNLRIALGFENVVHNSVDPLVAAAAWRRHDALVFTAVSCLLQGGPGFASGCLGMPEATIRPLTIVTVSVHGNDPTAPPDIGEQLDGWWQGSDYVLRVDSQRAQANIDEHRPFEWQRFVPKRVADDEVLFTIGADLFEAKVEPNRLVLTSTSFRGERILWRRRD